MTMTSRLPVSGEPDARSNGLGLVRPELDRVEELLRTEITSDVRKVYALGHHVLFAGGKRLRPALVALAARAVGPAPDIDRLAPIAACVELVHMATLVHDDVIDDADVRRGKATANAVFGNGVAVLTGDFLLARAMRLVARDGDLRIMRAISDITIEMSEGEVLEILAGGDATVTLEHHLEILRKKTAVFVEGCCRCGAILGRAAPEHEEALAAYGHQLGMAFQIADDLLDYTGDPDVTGKPIGSDLRDGRATLPLLLALQDLQDGERDGVLAAFGNAALCGGALADVVKVLESYSVFERTRAIARSYVEQAASALRRLPPSEALDCFRTLTEYVVQRDR
jgi:octaprenyl-diphosphate synthase